MELDVLIGLQSLSTPTGSTKTSGATLGCTVPAEKGVASDAATTALAAGRSGLAFDDRLRIVRAMTPIAPETLTAALQWRYAVKKFDPTKRIPAETWTVLEHALVLSPSSIGLQPWRFYVVTDPALRAELRTAAWNQSQVTDCSHFVVFAVRRNLGTEHVERHVARMAEVRGTTPESLARFGQMALRNLDEARAEGRLDVWQTHQIYIALGSFIVAAAVLGVDTCAMEGFAPEKFDALLGLTGTDFASVVACAAGYRHPEDQYAAIKKVRFKREDVIEER